MLEGSCHCGRLRWSFAGQPDGATACNCTICRRYGTLWIYGYEGEEITKSGGSRAYSRGEDRSLSFHFCPDCGCAAWWRGNRLEKDGRRRMAVNVRLAEPDTVAAILIDHFDGLVSFEDLPRDGRCVGDYWS